MKELILCLVLLTGGICLGNAHPDDVRLYGGELQVSAQCTVLSDQHERIAQSAHCLVVSADN